MRLSIDVAGVSICAADSRVSVVLPEDVEDRGMRVGCGCIAENVCLKPKTDGSSMLAKARVLDAMNSVVMVWLETEA
jgi:hypothetical protein